MHKIFYFMFYCYNIQKFSILSLLTLPSTASQTNNSQFWVYLLLWQLTDPLYERICVVEFYL